MNSQLISFENTTIVEDALSRKYLRSDNEGNRFQHIEQKISTVQRSDSGIATTIMQHKNSSLYVQLTPPQPAITTVSVTSFQDMANYLANATTSVSFRQSLYRSMSTNSGSLLPNQADINSVANTSVGALHDLTTRSSQHFTKRIGSLFSNSRYNLSLTSWRIISNPDILKTKKYKKKVFPLRVRYPLQSPYFVKKPNFVDFFQRYYKKSKEYNAVVTNKQTNGVTEVRSSQGA